jgi:hypothetical protein
MTAIDRPPAHQDAGVTVYLGEARDVLGALPAATMDCYMTLPPYRDLRDYGMEPRLWGGDPDCRHLWDRPNDCHDRDRVCVEPPRFPCQGRRVGRVAHADVRVAILDGVVLGHDRHLLVVDGVVSCHRPGGDLACASHFSESTR